MQKKKLWKCQHFGMTPPCRCENSQLFFFRMNPSLSKKIESKTNQIWSHGLKFSINPIFWSCKDLCNIKYAEEIFSTFKSKKCFWKVNLCNCRKYQGMMILTFDNSDYHDLKVHEYKCTCKLSINLLDPFFVWNVVAYFLLP